MRHEPSGPSRRHKPTERAGVIGALSAGLGAVIAAAATASGVLVAQQQGRVDVDTTRTGQLAERYAAASGKLGDESVAVRLGGIYALSRIMNDDADSYQVEVVSLLAAYIRENAATAGSVGYAGRPEADVHAAFEILVQRNPHNDDWIQVDLRQAHLPNIALRGTLNGDQEAGRAQLGASNISGAVMPGAWLPQANLRKARLVGTNLEKAALPKADFTAADMVNTKLQSADLSRANLRNADLRGADLKEANLKGADLRGAELRGEPEKKRGKTPVQKPRADTQVSVQQLLSARIDGDTELPKKLEKDPEIKKKLARLTPPH